MNIKHRTLWLATFLFALIVLQVSADVQLSAPPKPPASDAALAADSASPAATASALPAAQPGTAVIKASNVNARGQATVKSEVVAKFKKGDRVKIIEEITHQTPQPGDPDKWFKIELPRTTHVWVHSMFINSETHQVSASRLNLRSGPGENYSILGRVEEGATLKPVGSKGDWIEVAPPADAYAFVAAHLVEKVATTPPPTVAVTEPLVTIPPVSTTEANTMETTEIEPETPLTVAVDSSSTDEIPPNATLVTDTLPGMGKAPDSPLPSDSTWTGGGETEAATETTEETVVKRTVLREGIVKRSISIQAPTEFVLESLDNKRTINYLYSPSTNIYLRDFKGQRIMVSGEEGLDDRWLKTPVLTIETIKSVD